MMVLIAASFLLGFVRDLLIAWRFGASWIADVFFVVLMVPVFFENVLGIALRDALVLHFQRVRFLSALDIRRQLRHWQFGIWFLSLLVAVIVVWGSDLWLSVLVPGWSKAQIELASVPFQLAALLIPVQTILYFQAAVLNVEGRFLIPMWRTVLFNFGGIAAMLLFPSSLSAIIVGLVSGQFLLLLIQQRKLHLSQIQQEVERKAMKGGGHLVPLVMVAATQQGCVIMERFLGSQISEGAIAYLSYAYRVASIPLTLFSLSFLTFFYTAFAGLWVAMDKARFGFLLLRALNMSLIFLVPAAVLMVTHSVGIVSVLFARGEFGALQVVETAKLLVAYGFGLPAMGVALLGGRVLLAQGKSKSFMVASMLCSLVTLILYCLLYRPLGVYGLAIALSIGSWVQVVFFVVAGPSYFLTVKVGGVFCRWAVTGVLGFLFFGLLPSPESMVYLVLYSVAGLAFHLFVIALLGERSFLKSYFWRFGV